MKKVLSLCLVLVAAFAFGACSDDDDGGCTKGTDGCACTEAGACNAGLVCNADNMCETAAGDCCPDNPPPNSITLSGMVQAFPQGGVSCGLAPVMPAQFLTGQPLTHLADATSDASGIFMFDCFDVSNVSLGMIMLADDEAMDGADGTYYPTISGLASWPTDADKDCVEEAAAFVMPNAMLTSLAAFGIDADNDGYIFGMVLDADRNPLGGAIVLNAADGTEATGVVYPNADFSGVGTTTDPAHGIYLLPGPFAFGALAGELDGYTWSMDTYKAAAIAGYGYFVPLVAE